MTARTFIACAYAIVALGLAVVTHGHARSGAATSAPIRVAAVWTDSAGAVPLAEIEPELTGNAEIDDLPAYMGGDNHAGT